MGRSGKQSSRPRAPRAFRRKTDRCSHIVYCVRVAQSVLRARFWQSSDTQTRLAIVA
jgi:hypothetical protein